MQAASSAGASLGGGARGDQMMQHITGAHDYDQGPRQVPPRVTRQDLMDRVNTTLVIGASVEFHGVGTYETVPHDPHGGNLDAPLRRQPPCEGPPHDAPPHR